MAGLAGDGQGAVPVQGQVGLGEDGAVHVVVVRLDEVAGGGEGVLGLVGQGDEHLVGLPDIEGRAALAGDGDAVQHQLDLGRLGDADDDLPVGEGAGQQVGALGGDGDGVAVDGDAGPVGGGGAVGERHGDVIGVADLKIPVGEHVALRGDGGGGERLGRRGGGGAGGGGGAAAGGAAQAQRGRQDQREQLFFHGEDLPIPNCDGPRLYSAALSVIGRAALISRLPLRQRSSSISSFSVPRSRSVMS